MSKIPHKIGLWSCVAFAVGSMVGAGVFVLSGVAVQKAGPAAIASFVLAGLAILCSALSFTVVAPLAQQGELGYAPVGRLLGHRFWGFMTSWAFYLSAVICTAFVLNAFGAYLHDFFLPGLSPLTWSVIAAVGITLANLGNAANIGRIEDILVIVKVAVLILLIGFGLAHTGTHTFTPFMPHGDLSLLATSGLLFIAYLGFSVVANVSGDVKNAQRTVPLAITISVLGVLVLYIGVVIALLAFPQSHYDEASVGAVAEQLMGPVGGILIPIAALVSTLSAANSNILGSSEIMVRLAARKDVPTFAGRLWRGHPVVSVLFGAVVYIGLLASRQTNTVIALANVAAIVALLLVDVAAIRALSRGQSKTRIPGGRWILGVGFASALGELCILGAWPVVMGLGLVAAGTALYLGREVFHDPVAHRQLVSELAKYGGPVLRTLRKIEGRLNV
ncbi:MAG TPA: APC family permease [Candidatus Saccharimonadales bacterium]|nr:APC family permease [Candidatus Saccharimonadales bacterium]